MKCDKLKSYKANVHYIGMEANVYIARHVDEAIAELKDKIDEYVIAKLSAQQVLQDLFDCGLIKDWFFNGRFHAVLKADDPHLQIAELQAENAQLKDRIQLDDDEMAGFLQLEEECGGGDLRNYIAELKAENTQLKKAE